jgi:type I restriction enzyme R subunit
LIQRKLADLVRKNKSRVELGEKLKKLIDEYNKGQDVDSFFAQLLNFARELTAEERRGVADQLSEEELAVFDILTRPAPDLSAAERKQVKKVARNLLQTLKQAKLVLDWRTRLRTRADVLATVKTILDELPRVYTKELYEEKCETVWQHVYDSYFGEGESVYGRV